MNDDLQMKIVALGLLPVDESIYVRYLKIREDIGVDARRFTHYKMYKHVFMPYSNDYLIRTSLEELLKKDKENYEQFCPSFFVRLKDKYFIWKFKRTLKKLKKEYEKENN
ncbi:MULTISPECIES: hypothetical protein [Bacillus cereus group]|uniref:hypothetical protein n=1 Tax=Bacillus cereus group TaxID=86661 RepID=UPI000279FA86|nr:hypothetical protein [Bacillus cereus]EJR41399.1 hypothetical protein IIE_00415 [Bacillus cereus VD045]HDR4347947.1 hypothetical protein [Bacillus cereus]